MNGRHIIRSLALSLALAAPAVIAPVLEPSSAQAASEVRVVVNKEPITSFAINERAAFLKLRRAPGDLTSAATEELIDEALKKQEIRRRGVSVPDAMVDQAFAKFAQDNKLTEAQLSQVLSQAGFSARAFKDYIRVQIGWGQAVQRHVRQKEQMSEQDVVQRMLAQGGDKPSTTEYTLQQVIFVVPEAKRSALMSRRMQEANSLRQRFTSCDRTYDFAKGLRDVTVRELGRVAQPELPDFWRTDIQATAVGRTTAAKQTDKGVEFIAVCDARKISDDTVAAMVFQMEDMEKLGQSEPDAALLKELRDKAQIVRR